MLVIVLGVAMFGKKFVPQPGWKGDTRPMFALELPKDDAEVQALLGYDASNPARDSARESIRSDYALIVAYTLLFIAFALVHRPGWRVLLILAAAATAALDVWENAIILRFVDDPAVAVAAEVRSVAQAKWLCFFVAVALIAPLFARAAGGWWTMTILLILGGLAGIAARFYGRHEFGLMAFADALLLALAAVLLPMAVEEKPAKAPARRMPPRKPVMPT
jgi:hypothetical protein